MNVSTGLLDDEQLARSFFANASIRDVCDFCMYDDSIARCASRQEEELCNHAKEDVAFSNDSLRAVLDEDGHDSFRFYEAEICTYPTKFLTKQVSKLFADEFKVDMCWFSLGMHEQKAGETLVHGYERELMQYDRKLGKFITFEKFDAKNHSQCLVKPNVKYVEGEVAGKVIYVICFPYAGVLSKESMSMSLIKKLIECGDKYGYDYIASTKHVQDDMLEFHVSYESKMQESDIVISSKLYHVAKLRAKSKILKQGLNPHGTDYENMMKSRIAKRKSGKDIRLHPYRVYLFNGLDMWAITSFVKQKHYESTRIHGDECERYCLLEIDRHKVPHLKLYRDNNFESNDPKKPIALYTYTNIPPDAISFLKELDV